MIASGPAALQEDKSPHKTWTTPPLQKPPSGTVLKAWLSAMLSSLSYGTMADFQYTWIGWLHFQNSYECLHVQFTWWLLMTTVKFVQDGSGLSRRLSCSFDPSARRPVWERAGCLPRLDLARFWHYTLYSMKQTVVIAGGIAVHTFFLCSCIGLHKMKGNWWFNEMCKICKIKILYKNSQFYLSILQEGSTQIIHFLTPWAGVGHMVKMHHFFKSLPYFLA